MSQPRQSTSPARSFGWYFRIIAPIFGIYAAMALGMYGGMAFARRPQSGVAGIIERKEASWQGCRVWVGTEFGEATANFAHECAKIAWAVGQHVTVDIRPTGRSARSWGINSKAADLKNGDPLIAD